MSVLINELPVANTADPSMVLLCVTDPNGVPNTHLVTLDVLASSITSQLSSRPTPGSSYTPIKTGTFFFDANYLYLAVTENFVKRVPLQAF